ncbi:MAG: hypothetical protein N4A62_04910 [Marinisporobacter sp.]|nr:hypothetical protein [Marinisporobacter sp.]
MKIPEAIATGSLAGHNSVRLIKGMPFLELPVNLCIGDLIAYEHMQSKTEEGIKTRYTFAGADYFKRMKDLNLYTTNVEVLKKKIEKINLLNVFEEKLI